MSPTPTSSKSRGLLAAGVILVVIGILGGLKAYYQSRPAAPPREGIIERSAVLSGFEERVKLPDFAGARLTAILGGFSLDLRDVKSSQETIRLHVNIVCGGGEIRVPKGWTVSVQARTIAGGVEQKLRAASGDEDEDEKEASQAKQGQSDLPPAPPKPPVMIGREGPEGKEIRIEGTPSGASVVVVRKGSDGRKEIQVQGAPAKHHLIIEGLVVCGGLEVKN